MPSYKCDVIVLTWNKLDFTRKFVTSFLECTTVPCHLIIIDNASSDGTKDYLEALTRTNTGSHRVEVIFNKENSGYVGGVNQGIAISQAPYVCLANNDLIFTKGWLGEIISIFEKDSRIGVLNPNNGSEVAHEDKRFLASSSDKLKEKYRGMFAEKTFCTGFCMLIRREVIARIGALSDEFAPYFFEDTDYSLKTLKAGYLIGVAKGAFVWHKEHASLDTVKETSREKVFSRNKKIFQEKWGKILRILFIAYTRQELKLLLDRSIPLARSGNYVWIMTKNITQQRQEIFKEFDHTEHFNVNFIPVKNTMDILIRILLKKKRYDVIMAKNSMLCALLAKTGHRAFFGFNEEDINKIKWGRGLDEKKEK